MSTTRIRGAAERHPVPAFFLATFGYSWAVFGLLVLAVGPEQLASSRLWHVPFAWGPPLAAVVVQWLIGDDVRAWVRRIADPRSSLVWYGIAAAVAFLFADTRNLLAGAFGANLRLAQPIGDLTTSFFTTLLVAGSLEEFGWRGFAQLRLQQRRSALTAAVVVGLAFGLWHAPWLLLGGAGYGEGGPGALVGFTLFGVLASIVFAWLFNGSGGVVPVVMLAHAVLNTGSVLEAGAGAPGWLPETQLGLLLWVALVLLVIVAHGPETLAPRSLASPQSVDR